MGVSALTVLTVQGGISFAAGGFAATLLGGADPETLKTNPYGLMLMGAGGLTIIGISWNLMAWA